MTERLHRGLKRRIPPLLLLLALTAGHADQGHCEPDGALEFVCGLVDPEDLVPVEDSPWIIVSSLTPGDGLYAIDSRDRSVTVLSGDNAPGESHDAARFPSCAGAPTAPFSTHGLYIQRSGSGRHTLYVVVHGSRESIDVYDVVATDDALELTWTGCALLPDGHGSSTGPVGSSNRGARSATTGVTAKRCAHLSGRAKSIPAQQIINLMFR